MLQDRHRLNRRCSVQQPSIGISVHRQRNVTVSHRRLCGPRCDASQRQVSSEAMPQGVNVNYATIRVSLGNPRCFQVAVHDPK